MKAYGYCRVSGLGQISGTGLDRQEETIRRYADAHGYEIMAVYREEGVSGTKDEAHRPAFQEMVAAILADGVRTVIVEGLDRLAREYRIQESLLIYLASKEITLLSARTGENVTESIKADPMRKALVQIQGIFAELDKSQLVARLKRAREMKRKQNGKCEGCHGYKDKRPDIINAIQTYAEWGASCDDSAMALNIAGYRTLRGKEWKAKDVSNALRSC